MPSRTAAFPDRSEHGSRAAELPPQLRFGALKDSAALAREILPCAIDEEVQHRHGGLVRRALAPLARLGRMLEGARNVFRAARGENRALEIERIALPGDAGRPAVPASAGPGAPRGPRARARLGFLALRARLASGSGHTSILRHGVGDGQPRDDARTRRPLLSWNVGAGRQPPRRTSGWHARSRSSYPRGKSRNRGEV